MNLIFAAGKKELLLLITLSICQGILTSLEVVIWKYLVDGITDAIAGASLRIVVIMMLIYMLSAILNTILNRLSSHLNWSYTIKLNNRLNNMILDKCSKIEFVKYNESDTYDHISRISNESISSVTNLLSSITKLVQYIMAYISVVIILMAYNVFVILVATAAILPVMIVNVKMSKKLYKVNCEITEPKRLIAKLSAYFYDYKEIQEIKAYRSERFLSDKIQKMQHDNYRKESTVKMEQIKKDAGLNIAYIMLNYAMKLLSVLSAIRDGFSLGTITMYINSIDQISLDLQCIVSAVAGLGSDKYYVKAMLDFLNQEEAPIGEKMIGERIQDIRFEHVYFKYPGSEEYILEDISFSLSSGERYLLSGANGSGKSTIIKLILGFYKPDKGNIFINDIDINDINKENYYGHIGIVFQEYNKYPFTIKENITLDRDYSDFKLREMLEKVNMDEYIDKLPQGIEAILDNEQEDGTNLSLGQWQKIALCRMFYEPHDFIILDEPTASLDYNVSNKLIHECFGEDCKRMILIISHDPGIRKHVDTVYSIESGKLMQS